MYQWPVDNRTNPETYLETDSDEDLVHRYGFGLCGVMASVLHRITGWPVIGLHSWYSGQHVGGTYFRAQWGNRPCHVGIVNPETGLYTDGTGTERTLEEFSRPYFGTGTKSRVDQLSGHDFFVRRSFDYEACLLAHIPRLLPMFVDHPGAARLRALTRGEGFWPSKIDLDSYTIVAGGHSETFRRTRPKKGASATRKQT